jgi:hypothetical protein
VNIETTLWVLWSLWMLQAAFCACNTWAFPRAMARQDRAADSSALENRGRAAVIIAIKGTGPLTEKFLDVLLHQDHPAYRLIFCFESEDDPAAVLLRKKFSLSTEVHRHVPDQKNSSPGLSEILLVCAGQSRDCCQKVHNQRAAMDAIEPEDRYIAFSDADMLCKETWLSYLLAPIELDQYDLTSGYRWFVPETPGFITHLATVINASVATLGGREIYNMLWGGSMALRRDVYDKMDVPELFRGSLNDDLHLAREARVAGYRIGYRRSLLVPSPASFTLLSFVEFTRRQYYQDRHHSPKIYTGANILLWLYPLGWTTSLVAALSGNTLAWIPWIAVNLLFDQVRAFGRTRLVRLLFEEKIAARIRPIRALEHFATPLWMTIHALLCTSALAMSRITWAGTTYRIHGRRETQIISRE